MSGASHGGKGDSPRPYSKKNWDNSWDRIFNKNKVQPYANVKNDDNVSDSLQEDNGLEGAAKADAIDAG